MLGHKYVDKRGNFAVRQRSLGTPPCPLSAVPASRKRVNERLREG